MRWVLLLLAFQAAAATASDVRGKILLKTGTAEGSIEVRAGGVGGEGAGIPIEDSKVPMFKTFGSVTWDETKGLTFHYRKLPQGTRLITVAWKRSAPPDEKGFTSRSTHYLDWRWVEAKPPDPKETSPEIILTISPDVCGDMEVSLAPGTAAESVSFMPCNPEGKVPNWDDRRSGPTFTETVRDGKAHFKGMKPGKYVFYATSDAAAAGAPALSVVGEVKEKASGAVLVGAEK